MANQLTGFYLMETLVVHVLKSHFYIVTLRGEWRHIFWSYYSKEHGYKLIFPDIRITRGSYYWIDLQSSRSQMFFKIELQLAIKDCNIIKKRLRHRCFPVKFAKLLRTTFFTEHLRWLLLIFEVATLKNVETTQVQTTAQNCYTFSKHVHLCVFFSAIFVFHELKFSSCLTSLRFLKQTQ